MTDAEPRLQPTSPSLLGPEVEADLRRLLRSLWRRRFMILALVVLGALAGIGGSLLTTRYLSEGVLLTPPSIGVQDFKKYQSAMLNETRLRGFLELKEQLDEPDGALLIRTLRTPLAFNQAVKPEFAFTEQDVRAFNVTIEEAPRMVGLRLALAQKEADRHSSIRLLEEYVRDTIIKFELEARLLESCLANRTRELELRNEDLQGDFRLSQLEEKAQILQGLIQRLPGAAQQDLRQLVSLDKGGERYLSPTSQLVGTEMEISELRLAAKARDRERAASALRRDYYCSAREALGKPVLGRQFIQDLLLIRKATFDKVDLADPVVEEAYNRIHVEWQNWSNTYLDFLRFIVEPRSGQIPVRNPGLIVSTALGAILGGIFGVLLALLMTWWRHNRVQILQPEADD